MEPGVELYKKILAVMSEVEYVAKRGRNDFHKYDYVTEADIVTEIRTLLISHGLIVIPSVSGEMVQQGDITFLPLSFTIIDTETGQSLVSTIIGSGQDKGDKGPYKAYTGAQKYFFMKTFQIPTGDDPEREEASPTTRAKSESSVKSIGKSANGYHCEECNRELTAIPARNGKPGMPVTDYVDWVKKVTGGRILCSTCRKNAKAA